MFAILRYVPPLNMEGSWSFVALHRTSYHEIGVKLHQIIVCRLESGSELFERDIFCFVGIQLIPRPLNPRLIPIEMTRPPPFHSTFYAQRPMNGLQGHRICGGSRDWECGK